jgi:hypothetical protein
MRYIRNSLVLSLAAASDIENSVSNVHEFMVRFREYSQTRRVPVVSGAETCEELWRDHSPDRVHLYRMAAYLEELHSHIPRSGRDQWDPRLDPTVIPSRRL